MSSPETVMTRVGIPSEVPQRRDEPVVPLPTRRITPAAPEPAPLRKAPPVHVPELVPAK